MYIDCILEATGVFYENKSGKIERSRKHQLQYTKSIHKFLLPIPVHLPQHSMVRQLRSSTEKKKHGRLNNTKPLRGFGKSVFHSCLLPKIES